MTAGREKNFFPCRGGQERAKKKTAEKKKQGPYEKEKGKDLKEDAKARNSSGKGKVLPQKPFSKKAPGQRDLSGGETPL